MHKFLLMLIFSSLTAVISAQTATKQAPSLAENVELEKQVMDIAHELRCLVCQNETIAASHADLAVDLRQQIRSQLQQGQTAQQIRDFMVDRYGEFVLYNPRWSAKTVLLWVGPFVLLGIALLTLWLTVRRRFAEEADTELTPDDVRRARQLLGQPEEKNT